MLQGGKSKFLGKKMKKISSISSKIMEWSYAPEKKVNYILIYLYHTKMQH